MSRRTKKHNTLPFTEQAVRDVRPIQGKRTEYRDPDSRYPGLVLRVNIDRRKIKPTVSRIWIYRPSRKNEEGKRPCPVLGAWPEMNVSSAIDVWKKAEADYLDNVNLHERIRRRWSAVLEDLVQASREEQLRVLQDVRGLIRRSGITLDALVTRFIESKMADGVDLRKIRATFDRHVPKAWLQRPAEDIELQEVSDLLTEVKVKKKVPVAANKLYALLKPAYDLGWRQGALAHNPIERLSKPYSRIVRRKRFLTDNEIIVVGTELERRNFQFAKPVFWLLLLFGCRRIELLKMRWEDLRTRVVDGETVPVFHVRETKQKRPYDIFLGPTAQEVIEELKKIRRSEWVFYQSRDLSKSFHEQTITKNILQLSEELVLKNRLSKKCGPHDLRRTLTTHIAEMGAHPTISKAIIGHSIASDEGSLSHYLQPDLSRQVRQWALRWDEHVGRLRQQVRSEAQGSPTE